MNEPASLLTLKDKAIADHEYFSNSNKPERERYVVSLFLSFLGVSFDKNDLKSPEQDSLIDVFFQDAAFQIKELMDEGYLRGKILKDRRRSAENATTLKDLHWASEAYDTQQPARMIDLVYEEAKKQAGDKKYASEKDKIDLLIYVTRTRASLIQDHEIQERVFSALGWRSVLCVNEKQALILYSSKASPEFICNKATRVFVQKQPTDSCAGDQT